MIFQHVCSGEEDAKKVLQGGMSGFKHDLSYTMTGTEMSHSISIQGKSVLEDASCEASEASMRSDCFCLHGTEQMRF